MKKLLSIAMCVIMALALITPAFAGDVDVSRPEKAHMAFNEDGKFTILQVSDIQDDALLSGLAKKSIINAVEVSKPDISNDFREEHS